MDALSGGAAAAAAAAVAAYRAGGSAIVAALVAQVWSAASHRIFLLFSTFLYPNQKSEGCAAIFAGSASTGGGVCVGIRGDVDQRRRTLVEIDRCL